MEKSFCMNATKFLYEAIRMEDDNQLLQAIQNGADVNHMVEEGYTPLIQAIQYSNFGAIRILLKNGADPNKTNNIGQTPLEIAIKVISRVSDFRALYILLQNGADPNIPGFIDCTALTTAILTASGKTHNTVSKLLQFGAQPNIQDSWGNTCLHKAIQELWFRLRYFPKDDLQICSLIRSVYILLENGADPTIQNDEGLAATDDSAWATYLEEVETNKAEILKEIWDKRKQLLLVRNQLCTKIFRQTFYDNIFDFSKDGFLSIQSVYRKLKAD